MAKTSKPGKIHLKIIEVMKRFPDGITGGQIREELAREGLLPGNQTHLDRRKRDLKKWFLIQTINSIEEVEGKKLTSPRPCSTNQRKSVPIRE